MLQPLRCRDPAAPWRPRLHRCHRLRPGLPSAGDVAGVTGERGVIVAVLSRAGAALDLLVQGIASTLAPQNLADAASGDSGAVTAYDPLMALLYDPQTAGDSWRACSTASKARRTGANGALPAAIIGRVTAVAIGTPRITLTP
ncbi:MAG: hypothetical protein MZV70_45685 [Desulfobacterales bacterium]|nr:hypothetical protein [Desulfobacterales bacterium]